MIKSNMKKEAIEVAVVAVKALALLLVAHVSLWLVFPCSIILDLIAKKTIPTETLDQKTLETENTQQLPNPSIKDAQSGNGRQNASPNKTKKRRTSKVNGDKQQTKASPSAPKSRTRRSK